MSYYSKDATQPSQWHQHSQTSSYSTTNAGYTQANGTQQAGQRQPIGPLLNQTLGNIVSDLRSNMDKEYFKTTCGMLSCIETIAVLVIFIISTSLQSYTFLTLITGFAFWISLFFLLINLFQVPEKVKVLPWPRMQFFFLVAAAVLFLFEAIVLIFSNGILCLLALHLAALYGYHSYDKLKEIGRVIAAANAETQQTANLNV